MRILAVDPGKKTGWAIAEQERGDWPVPVTGALPQDEFLDFVWEELAGAYPPDVIVCEAYLIGPQTLKKTRGENWSLEQIGTLRWMAHYWGREFVLQTPAQAKVAVPDETLKLLGFWIPGQEDHERDALRHFTLLVTQRDAGFRRRLAEVVRQAG